MIRKAEIMERIMSAKNNRLVRRKWYESALEYKALSDGIFR